jgi:hypothetical protein
VEAVCRTVGDDAVLGKWFAILLSPGASGLEGDQDKSLLGYSSSDDSYEGPPELPGIQTLADVWWPEDSARLTIIAIMAIKMTTTGKATPDGLSSW